MQLVSVVMPAYNAAPYIKESINSVLNQTYTNWELLIVNDGSTDETLSIVKEYSRLDSRILIIDQENSGLGSARNAAISKAKGEWIAFLDSDDLWVNEKLERQLQACKEDPSAAVIFTNGFTFYNNDLKEVQEYETIGGKFTGKEMYHVEIASNIIPVLSVIVRRSLIEKVGLQEVNKCFYGCEDWDYWLRMARSGATYIGLEEKLFYYRRHNNNMSADLLKMRTAGICVLLKNLDWTLIDRKEAYDRFKRSINRLILDLVQGSKIAEAVAVTRMVKKVFPGIKYFLVFNLIKYLKTGSLNTVKRLLKSI